MMAMKLNPKRGKIHEPIGVSSRLADPDLHSSEYRNPRRAAPDRRAGPTFRGPRSTRTAHQVGLRRPQMPRARLQIGYGGRRLSGHAGQGAIVDDPAKEAMPAHVKPNDRVGDIIQRAGGGGLATGSTR
jgi:hypothetical protein